MSWMKRVHEALQEASEFAEEAPPITAIPQAMLEVRANGVFFASMNITDVVRFSNVYDVTRFMSSIDASYQLPANTVWERRAQHAEWNKEFTRHYGWAPSAALKAMNAALYRYWFANHDYWSYKFGARHVGRSLGARTTYKPSWLRLVKQVAPWLDQAKADGLMHITPLIFGFQLDPHGLKELFGKGLWKSLSHNSFSRNLLLAHRWIEGEAQRADPKEWMFAMQQVPSTLLPRVALYFEESLSVLQLALRLRPERTSLKDWDISRIQGTIVDCYRMADQLGEPVRELRSAVDLLVWHDTLVDRQHGERYAYKRVDLTAVPNWYVPFEWSVDGYAFTLLKNGLELAEEGEAMHHCVAIYRERYHANEYFVLSCTKGGKRIATVGLRRSHPAYRSLIVVDQAYGPCNKRLEDARLVLAVAKVCDQFYHAYKDVGPKRSFEPIEEHRDLEVQFGPAMVPDFF